jgi:hypothetical protein
MEVYIMKEKLNNVALLLILVAFMALTVMLFMGIAFELTAVTVISGIIAIVSGISGIGIGLYSEEVL